MNPVMVSLTVFFMLTALGLVGYLIYAAVKAHQAKSTTSSQSNLMSNASPSSTTDDNGAELGRNAELLVNLTALSINVFVLLLLYYKTMDIDSKYKYLLFSFVAAPVLVLFFIVYTLHYNPTIVNASVTILTTAVFAIMVATFAIILLAKDVTVKPGSFASVLKSGKPGTKVVLAS